MVVTTAMINYIFQMTVILFKKYYDNVSDS